jgi:DUF971 family protein
MNSIPQLTDIKLHQQSKTLELTYATGETFTLSAEYLRVYSPSAEVQGHGPGQAVLQIGKMHVAITAIAPVGNYAIQPTFSDDHDSGIYTWPYLYELATSYDQKWSLYLLQLHEAGASRDPQLQVVKLWDGDAN